MCSDQRVTHPLFCRESSRRATTGTSIRTSVTTEGTSDSGGLAPGVLPWSAAAGTHAHFAAEGAKRANAALTRYHPSQLTCAAQFPPPPSAAHACSTRPPTPRSCLANAA